MVDGAVGELQFTEQRDVASIGFQTQEKRILGNAAQAAVALPIGAVEPFERLFRFTAKCIDFADLGSHVGGVLGDEFLQGLLRFLVAAAGMFDHGIGDAEVQVRAPASTREDQEVIVQSRTDAAMMRDACGAPPALGQAGHNPLG